MMPLMTFFVNFDIKCLSVPFNAVKQIYILVHVNNVEDEFRIL